MFLQNTYIVKIWILIKFVVYEKKLKKQSETFVRFHEIDEVFVYDSVSMLKENGFHMFYYTSDNISIKLLKYYRLFDLFG